jgi:hypothetical protein
MFVGGSERIVGRFHTGSGRNAGDPSLRLRGGCARDDAGRVASTVASYFHRGGMFSCHMVSKWEKLIL